MLCVGLIPLISANPLPPGSRPCRRQPARRRVHGVFDRDLPLTLAAMMVERFQRGTGAGQRAGLVLAPSLEGLFLDHGAPVASTAALWAASSWSAIMPSSSSPGPIPDSAATVALTCLLVGVSKPKLLNCVIARRLFQLSDCDPPSGFSRPLRSSESLTMTVLA